MIDGSKGKDVIFDFSLTFEYVGTGIRDTSKVGREVDEVRYTQVRAEFSDCNS